MSPEAITELLTAWECQRADVQNAWSYLSPNLRELVADDATWTIDDRGLLLVASDAAVAVLALDEIPGGVTIKGDLYPIQDDAMRVSFADRLEAEVEAEGDPAVEPFKPVTREWSFRRGEGLRLHVAYWVWPPLDSPVKDHFKAKLAQDKRQRAVAHKLASAAGWPMPPSDEPSDT
jgi:hypothetical protein